MIRKNYSPLTLRGTEVLLEMEPTTLSLGTEPLLMLVEASTRSIVSNGDPKIILHIQKKLLINEETKLGKGKGPNLKRTKGLSVPLKV